MSFRELSSLCRAGALTLCIACLSSTPVLAQVENNPGYDRPGLGFTPAVLQPGDFMLELGLPDWSRNNGSSLYNANTLVRLGVGHSMELQLGTGWNWLTGSGSHADGRSSTSASVKIAPPARGLLNWGLLLGAEFTDGAQAFQPTENNYLLGASINWQRSHDNALQFYVEATHGDTPGQLVAINNEWVLAPILSMYVELAAQHLDEVGYGTSAGAGLTLQITDRMQLDMGVRHRVGGHADTWQGDTGFAVYFGR